jgi:hypothetical protein
MSLTFTAWWASGCDDCGGKKTGAPVASSSAPTAASAAPASPLDQACGDYASALCAKLAGCEGGAALKWRFPDDAKCKERAKRECTFRLGAPDVTFAAADMGACTKAVQAAACDALGPGVVPAACQGKGKRTNGAACVSDAQCESGLCDRAGLGGERGIEALLGGGDAGDAECGKCEAPAKEGDVCLDVMLGKSASCARGLACDTSGEGSAKCAKPKRPDAPAARGADGEACKSDEACLEPAVCVHGKCKVLDAAACR